jgi:CubicO group peptidase (beta-lactamase class C family)
VGEAYFTADDKPSGDWFARTVAFDASTLHDMRSVSKSVVGLLVGIAHGRGQLDRERPVMDWFPEHAALATPERRAMRMEHLLTMTAGFEWDESSVSYANLGNSETRLGLSADPVGYVRSRDMVAAPVQSPPFSIAVAAVANIAGSTGPSERSETFAPEGTPHSPRSIQAVAQDIRADGHGIGGAQVEQCSAIECHEDRKVRTL